MYHPWFGYFSYPIPSGEDSLPHNGFFAFICFAVASLSFSMGFSFGDITTLITAVGLASKATQTDIKNLTTPAALDFPYLCGLNIFDNSSSGIAHNRKK